MTPWKWNRYFCIKKNNNNGTLGFSSPDLFSAIVPLWCSPGSKLKGDQDPCATMPVELSFCYPFYIFYFHFLFSLIRFKHIDDSLGSGLSHRVSRQRITVEHLSHLSCDIGIMGLPGDPWLHTVHEGILCRWSNTYCVDSSCSQERFLEHYKLLVNLQH